jgi:hypothetical protein
MSWACSTNGEEEKKKKKKAYGLVVGKSEG